MICWKGPTSVIFVLVTVYCVVFIFLSSRQDHDKNEVVGKLIAIDIHTFFLFFDSEVLSLSIVIDYLPTLRYFSVSGTNFHVIV